MYKIKRLGCVYGIYKDGILQDFAASYEDCKMIIQRYKK